jgi:hypothetical protein
MCDYDKRGRYSEATFRLYLTEPRSCLVLVPPPLCSVSSFIFFFVAAVDPHKAFVGTVAQNVRRTPISNAVGIVWMVIIITVIMNIIFPLGF